MRSRRDRVIAVAMVLPSFILLAIFVYGFIGQTAWVSLTDWGERAALALRPEVHFKGMQNYKDLFTGLFNQRFRQDVVNMLVFTALFVTACLVMGLLLASLIDQPIWGEGLFRTIFLFPMSLSFIVTGTISRWLFQPSGGINALGPLVGLPRGTFLWLSSREQVLQFNWQAVPRYLAILAAAVLGMVALIRALRRRFRVAAVLAAPAVGLALAVLLTRPDSWQLLPFPEPLGFNLALVGVVIAATWQMSGYTMALFLAGLRTIPDELREAARVDGANRLQVYRYVELPLITPITWSAVIVLGHIALKIFDLIFAMAGPDNASTSVPALSMYLTTFRGNQFAKGASIAVVLLFTVSLLIIPYLVTSLAPRSGK